MLGSVCWGLDGEADLLVLVGEGAEVLMSRLLRGLLGEWVVEGDILVGCGGLVWSRGVRVEE